MQIDQEYVPLSWFAKNHKVHSRIYNKLKLSGKVEAEVYEEFLEMIDDTIDKFEVSNSEILEKGKFVLRQAFENASRNIQIEGVLPKRVSAKQKYLRHHCELIWELNSFSSEEIGKEGIVFDDVGTLLDVASDYIGQLKDKLRAGSLDSPKFSQLKSGVEAFSSGGPKAMEEDEMNIESKNIDEEQPSEETNSIVGPKYAEEDCEPNSKPEVVEQSGQAQSGKQVEQIDLEYFWPANAMIIDIQPSLEVKSYGKMMTLKEASEFLNLSVSQIRQLMSGKGLRRYRNGFYPIELMEIGLSIGGKLCRDEYMHWGVKGEQAHESEDFEEKIGCFVGENHYRMASWESRFQEDSFFTYGDYYFAYGLGIVEAMTGLEFFQTVSKFPNNAMAEAEFEPLTTQFANQP